MSKRPSLSVILWSSVIAAGVVAACSGDKGARSTQPAAPSAPKGESVSPSPDAAPAIAHGGARSIIPTAMTEELRAMQIDLGTIPPLGKLEGDKLRKVMKLFARSLGAKCSDCHADDFAAPTPMKTIATRMWDDFVRQLSRDDGNRLFCDSCHQGRLKFLDRNDKNALSDWMEANFVSHIKRADGKNQNCEQCHGDPFDGKFLVAWSAQPASTKH